MERISQLNDNDVLMGRGTASYEYIGNRRFREFVEQHKARYTSTKGHETKGRIAKQVYDHITKSLGGRFLKLDETAEPVEFIIEEGTWYEVSEKVGLEKCKQTLREKRMPAASERASSRPQSAATLSMTTPTYPFFFGFMPGVYLPTDMGAVPFPPNLFPVVPPTQVASVMPSTIDARLQVFQSASFALQQQVALSEGVTANSVLYHYLNAVDAVPPNTTSGPMVGASIAAHQFIAPSENLHGNGNARDKQAEDTAKPLGKHKRDDFTQFASSRSALTDALPVSTTEDEVSEFILSALAISDRPRFTDQEHALEQANLTDEERATLLSDLFGKLCKLSDVRKDKRANRDLDKESIAFLVRQMRVELERIPKTDKEALLQAQAKCKEDEFSDGRIEQFLRCEGMNPKVSASQSLKHDLHSKHANFHHFAFTKSWQHSAL